MPSAAYFRRQADICVRLSVIASDQELVTRLLAMAEDYKTKAGAMENDAELIPPPMIGLDNAPDAGVDRA
jgi:hypothetical protein